MADHIRSSNFDLQRELAERSELDWKFGALSQPGIVSIPLEDRDEYLPLGETQFDSLTDFTDCASRSPVNHLEALFTYHYRHDMKPENKLWMESAGYLQDGKVTFSDRYIAVLSGTTRQGNSLKSPLETIRKRGLIPKSRLPKGDTMTWDEYYTSVPSELTDLGEEFLTRFMINYEQVDQIHFGDVLRDDMIGVAGFAWPLATDGVYPKTEGTFNHAFLIYNFPRFQIFDNYTPFEKNLAADYSFYDYGYRVYVSSEVEKKSVVIPTVVSLTQQLADLLKKLLACLQPAAMPAPPDPIPLPMYLWDTPANSRHSIRVICDDMKLTLKEKNIITAVIQAESGFKNDAICRNKDKNGILLSTDWGICQVNDHYHIGFGKKWSSIKQVIDNPDKVVRWMIALYKQGKLSMWVAFSSGAYKKFLP